MRATINFEMDIDKVEDAMAALVSQEASTLHITANILDNLGHRPLLQEVTEALDLLLETTSQLEQYKSMMISFEQAKYQNLAPPPPDAATPPVEEPQVEDKEAPFRLGDLVRRLRLADDEAKSVTKFDDFVGRIQEESKPVVGEEDPSEKPVPEG
tara:strand:- start:1468 stop:1932 length:465 start_codon:yes stop_codon:yes gene_type:complete